ncbi:MAG TPA: lipase family protein [Thermoanaerobaculia bacterium]|nr:lipase family protein [Thermoanaerobaculia bacterium]
MPRSIPYDPSRKALLFPELGDTVLKPGAPPAEPLLCVEAARLAYKKAESGAQAMEELRAIFRGIALDRFEFLDEWDTEAFLAGSPDLAVLAFRGTEQKVGDFATDLDAAQVGWPRGGRVHAGFAHALKIAWPTIETWLATPPQPRRLIFTGHSLGAALATLAASLHPPDALYTFGSPRVGDAAFTATLAGVQTFRYVDCCDLICRIPPENLLVEHYQHVGQERYIDSAGTVHENFDDAAIRRDQTEARERYFVELAWRRGTVPVRDLADHAPINYVSAVWGS